MEIGSFLELELRETGEYYRGNEGVARLNTGRGGILHALYMLNNSSIHIPHYLCPTVKSFLVSHGIKVQFYYITDNFEPVLSFDDSSSAVLIVNYFGIISEKKIIELKKRFKNVIVDNCPAFFSNPTSGCYNIYSTRKFFGVPDGSYVLGPSASKNISTYNKDYSSETSAFLLKRIERGSSVVYSERMKNESRLEQATILRMSDLTARILRSIDYENIKVKRLDNFRYAHKRFGKYNQLHIDDFIDENCVPLVYPLLVEDQDLVEKLKSYKIYTGRWWKHVIMEVSDHCFENYLSRFMVPLPIDQRYGREEIDYIYRKFKDVYKPRS